MSSVETDGIGTPDDSVLSWEGGATTEETTNEHVVAEEMASQPVIYQGNGTMSYESHSNQTYEGQNRVGFDKQERGTGASVPGHRYSH